MKEIQIPSGKDINNDGIFGGINQLDVRHLADTRKPKLTLRDLNRLKHIQRIKSEDSEERNKLIGRMFAPPPSEPTL